MKGKLFILVVVLSAIFVIATASSVISFTFTAPYNSVIISDVAGRI